jgi:hypothetical protein
MSQQTAARKRIGRPMKPPAKGKRISLGLKVTAELKNDLDKLAAKSGRTQSQEAERLIELALRFDELLEGMRADVRRIRDGNVEAAFRAAGYTPVHSPHGKIWVPKGYPLKQVSGFIPPADEEN